MKAEKFKLRLGEVLNTYTGEVTHGSRGYGICCPFHQDTKPSCTVFYDTGVFFCLANCGKKPLAVGLRRLGVPSEVIDEFVRKEDDDDRRIAALPDGEIGVRKDLVPDKVSILTEDKWDYEDGYGYRQIRSVTSGVIAATFNPTLVRLKLGSRGRFKQERFKRLCLHYGRHAVFCRLASEQKVKYYNSSGLDMSDPKLHPFGLTSFTLPPNLSGMFLVEGPYDVLRTMQNLEDIGVMGNFVVIGLLGVAHWSSFLKKLETRLHPQLGMTPLLFAFDNDKAGKNLTDRAIEDCRRKLRMPANRLLVFPYETKDPGEGDKIVLKKGLIRLGY